MSSEKFSRWLVIDAAHKPLHLHLYPSKGRQWRDAVGDEATLPQCEICLGREAKSAGRDQPRVTVAPARKAKVRLPKVLTELRTSVVATA
jgi:hypothetical protein